MSMQALKPGGHFVLESYTSENIGRMTGGPQDADLLCDRKKLEALFSDLPQSALVCKEFEREIMEGSKHNGLSAVVQLELRNSLRNKVIFVLVLAI